MSESAFETTVPVRYRDLDALGHVNNAAYATYVEEARIAFFLDGLGIDPDDIDTVVAHLELDFHAPLRDAREVTVAVDVRDLGEKSYTFGYEVRHRGTVVASGETVQVWVGDDGRASVVPDEVRDALEEATTTTR